MVDNLYIIHVESTVKVGRKNISENSKKEDNPIRHTQIIFQQILFPEINSEICSRILWSFDRMVCISEIQPFWLRLSGNFRSKFPNHSLLFKTFPQFWSNSKRPLNLLSKRSFLLSLCPYFALYLRISTSFYSRSREKHAFAARVSPKLLSRVLSSLSYSFLILLLFSSSLSLSSLNYIFTGEKRL